MWKDKFFYFVKSVSFVVAVNPKWQLFSCICFLQLLIFLTGHAVLGSLFEPETSKLSVTSVLLSQVKSRVCLFAHQRFQMSKRLLKFMNNRYVWERTAARGLRSQSTHKICTNTILFIWHLNNLAKRTRWWRVEEFWWNRDDDLWTRGDQRSSEPGRGG